MLKKCHMRQEGGQSLLETALILPMMLVLVLNAVNLAYYFYVALNLTTSVRQGAQYSIEGYATPIQGTLPSADTISTLTYSAINAAVSGTSTTPMQVCSEAVGISGSGSNTVTQCKTYNGFTSVAPHADPEAPWVVLNRVDLQYTPSPLVAGALFNIVPTPTLHTFLEMRSTD
jgi:Flp pilus assembly protein TadG